MMCALFKSMMDVYIDGRLAGFQARRLERHVLTCPKCAAELASWRRLSAELRSITTPPPPEKLKVMLQAAIAIAKYADSGRPEYTDDPPLLVWESTTAVVCGVMVLLLSLSIAFIDPRESIAGAVDNAIQYKK